MIIGTLLVSALIGFIAGVLTMNHLAVLAERDRLNDIATGTPVGAQLAREMKLKLGWNNGTHER